MVERIEEEIKGWRERQEMDEKGNGGVSEGNRTAFKEGAQKLNGRHLILNCSDSDVTQLVTSTLPGHWTSHSLACDLFLFKYFSLGGAVCRYLTASAGKEGKSEFPFPSTPC